jgi:biopolymer transport protein ExbB
MDPAMDPATDPTAGTADPAALGAVDPSQGGLLDRALELIQAGGPVVAVLALMSVVALAIVLAKLWQFRMARLGDRRTVREALELHRRGREGEALVLLESTANPAAQAVARALRGRRRGLPEDLVREEVHRYGAAALETLRSWMRPLEVIASLAPLLGLFGTVLGMISAFQQLEAAGNQVNPSVLSGGIWEALLTTAVGLAVAIPVVAVLNWLERRVERLAHDIDDAVTRLFTVDLSAGFEDEIRHAPRFDRAAAQAGE